MFRADSDNRKIATVPSREAWANARTEADGMKFEAMRFNLESRSFRRRLQHQVGQGRRTASRSGT